MLHDTEWRSEQRNEVSSVDKALQVLLLLGRETEPLGVREIGRRLSMSPPTVHRLLATMATYDLVQQVNGRSDYRLGFACIALGRAALGGTELAAVASEVARDLRDLTKETVTAQIRRGSDQVVVVEAEGLHELRRRVGIGRRMPLHAGASGRAILAFLPPKEIEEYLAGPLKKVGPNTVTDPKALRRRLDEDRKLGYTSSHQETVVGVAAASVPIFGPDARVVGSLSVSGPEARLGAELERRIVPDLIRAGNLLSRALGHEVAATTDDRPAVGVG
jgi:DNA-binding IclR family transcriptional regulator